MNTIKTVILPAVALAAFLAALLASGMAAAETKARKPLICADFEVYKAQGREVGVCLDGKAPRVWKTWAKVELDGSTYYVGH